MYLGDFRHVAYTALSESQLLDGLADCAARAKRQRHDTRAAATLHEELGSLRNQINTALGWCGGPASKPQPVRSRTVPAVLPTKDKTLA